MKKVNAIFSLFSATLTIIILHICFQATSGDSGNPTLHRIFTLLGGNFMGGGYIQFLTYLAFYWGLVDIFNREKKIKKENDGFVLNILPTKETHLLLPADVKELVEKVRLIEGKRKYLITDVIKKACIKFRATNSVAEMIEIVSMQVEINKEKAESDQSTIRYLTWGIPSLGFIGTVLGISQALTIANSGDMNQITAVLGVAFDTTLVSLVLSIIIMWYFHDLQEKTDNLHANMKEYIIEHLINRIEM